MSQIAMLMASIIVTGEYNTHKNFPEGSVLSHAIMEELTGQMM